MVHGRATHPAEIAIRREGALLEDGGGGRAPDLVPTDGGAAAVGDGVVHHQGFVIAEIAIGQAVHKTVSERIQLLGCAWLGDAGAATSASASECGYGNVGRSTERGRAVGKVGIGDGEYVERVGVEIDKVFGRACGRRRTAVQVGGENTAEAGAQLEADLGCRAAGQHRGAVKGAELGTSKGLPVVEDVVGDVVSVVPNAQFGVVDELHGPVTEGVNVIGAGGVGG